MTKKLTGFRLEESTNDKLSYIAWHDRTTQTAIVNSLLLDFISKWEKKNGAITADQVKKAKG